jgi:hypothetical protein
LFVLRLRTGNDLRDQADLASARSVTTGSWFSDCIGASGLLVVVGSQGSSSAKSELSLLAERSGTSATSVKVLTHRPRYIEPTTVPEFTGETSSATEAEEPTLLPEVAEMAEVPATEKIKEPETEEAKTSAEGVKASEILNPSEEIEASEIKKGPTVTPKRKRNG